MRRSGDAVAQPSQLLQPVNQRRRGRVGGELGERGVERNQDLQRPFARASFVQIEPSAQRELLGRARGGAR